MSEILLGSHVGMSGKEMFLGSVKEAAEYGANTLMVYTGAPQNTRRKEIGELRIDECHGGSLGVVFVDTGHGYV